VISSDIRLFGTHRPSQRQRTRVSARHGWLGIQRACLSRKCLALDPSLGERERAVLPYERSNRDVRG
jgi:hypothetical protein